MLYTICKAADLYGLSQEPECLAILTLLAIVRRDALLLMINRTTGSLDCRRNIPPPADPTTL